MAAPGPVSRALTAKERKLLESSYDELRDLTESLQIAEHNISLALAAKNKHYPRKSQLSTPPGLGKRQGQYPEALGIEWWHWAFDAPEEEVDRKLEEMIACKTRLESIRSNVQSTVNDASRPFLRNLNILDLPDELILAIFELVEGFDFGGLSHPLPPFRDIGNSCRVKHDMQNTRLVCRRFCAISSPLLVRAVYVDLTESSLARLEEISRHPTISKGVRLVRVVLHFFNPGLEDLDWFIAYHADRFEEKIGWFDRLKTWMGMGLSQQTGAEMIAERRAIVTALRRHLPTDSGDGEEMSAWTEDDQAHLMRVERIHREYLVLLEKQQAFMSGGKFSRGVGSAIARMPNARHLGFLDSFPQSLENHRLMMHGVDVWGELRRVMLQPMTYCDAKEHEFELPDYQCVVGVINAVQSAGALLSGIEIDLTCPGWSGESLKWQAFSSGMRQLKDFVYDCGSNPNETDANDVNQFLAACLDTSSLQKLSFMTSGLAEEPRIDVGKVLGTRSRPGLTDISLQRVDIDLPSLVLLLHRLPESMHSLSLDNVRLLNGTWKEALDALRTKKSLIKSFCRPQGAECDDMSLEDYEMIFGNARENYDSKAELYITNAIRGARNPVQALEDGLDTGTEEY